MQGTSGPLRSAGGPHSRATLAPLGAKTAPRTGETVADDVPHFPLPGAESTSAGTGAREAHRRSGSMTGFR